MKKRKMNMILAITAVLAFGMVLMAGCSQQSGVQSAVPNAGSTQQSGAPSPAAGSSPDMQSSAVISSQQPNAQPSAAIGTATGPDADGDGIPDDIEKTYGTNPYAADTDGDGQNDAQDQQPATGTNPINETSTAPLPISFRDVRVEDNATADHLEMTLKNTGTSTLNSFDIFYTITDKADGTMESYYVKLSGLSLAAGETKTIHFDNLLDQPGHYYGNPNGLYGTSANGLTFNIELHNAGYQPLNTTVEKAPGVEVAD